MLDEPLRIVSPFGCSLTLRWQRGFDAQLQINFHLEMQGSGCVRVRHQIQRMSNIFWLPCILTW